MKTSEYSNYLFALLNILFLIPASIVLCTYFDYSFPHPHLILTGGHISMILIRVYYKIEVI